MKTKHIIAIIGVFFISISAFPQWNHQFGGVWENWVNDIYFVDSDTGYAIEDYTYLYKSINGGGVWDSISDFGGISGITSIYFITSDIGIGVGLQGDIIKTIDGGYTWSSMTSGTTNELMAIDCIDSDTLFVAGTNTVLRSDDQGLNWQTIYSGTEYFHGIDFINSKIGYVSGNNSIIKTLNSGSSWLTVNTDPNYKISCASEDVCYAASFNDIIRKTTDGGISWTDYSMGSNYDLADIQTINENIVFVACTTFYELTTIKTIDGGTNWLLQEQVNDSLGSNAIFLLNENEGWLSGLGGIYYTNNGGGAGIILSTNIDNQNNILNVELYPNPTNNNTSLMIETSENLILNYCIIDNAGRLIIEKSNINLNQGTNHIPINERISEGIYFLKLEIENKLYTRKLIKL